ncbi:MAG: immunoglobulin domain-containing protein [Verrucomicrobia bacterium]|nr:immunoglobulin domain-containing protein [Verrucomicrobiota bacterium]
MKKTILFVVPLLWAMCALGQGQVNFNNRVATVVSAPIYGPDPVDPNLELHGNPPASEFGVPPGDTIYRGEKLSGAGYSAQLFGGPFSSSEAQLLPATVVNSTEPLTFSFRTGIAAGFVASTQTAQIPGTVVKSNAVVQLRVWDNRGGTITNWEMAVTNPLVSWGVSELFEVSPLGGIPTDGSAPQFNPDLTGLRSFNIHLHGGNSAPVIYSAPANTTAVAGDTVIFRVGAAGASPLTYQWLKNGESVPRATLSTLKLLNVQAGDAGSYSVIVANANGSKTSSSATLAVNYSLAALSDSGGSVSASPQAPSYPPGTVVVLTALPAVGFGFTGWSGSATGTNNPLTVVMDGNKSINASFTRYLLSVTTSGSGTVTRNPNQTFFAPGSVVTLTALPAVGFGFTGWSGSATGTVNPLMVVMDGNKSVNASFASNELRVVTTTGGKVLRNPNQTNFASGTTVILTAVPDPGYGFTGWSGDATGTNNPTSVVINGNKTVFASFASYALTVTNTAGGTVTRDPNQTNFPPGSLVTLTATPASGFGFLNWSGDASGNDSPLTLVMDTNKNVGARFVSTVLTLRIQGGGTAARVPDKPFYALGDAVTLTATPTAGHVFTSWSDGDTTNPRVVIIGASNSYTAVFSLIPELETLTFGGVTRVAQKGTPAIFVDGEFVITGSVTRVASAQISMLTTFENGELFYTLDDSEPFFDSRFYENPFTLRSTATIRAVAFDAELTDWLESDPVEVIIIPTYSLSATTAGGGTVTVDPIAPGWTLLQWLGDLAGNDPTNTLVMSRDKCVQAVFGTAFQSTANGAGTVLVDPVTDFYPYGTVVRLTGVPDAGNFFAIWGNAAGGSLNPLNFPITNANPTVSSLFSSLPAAQYALTVIADGYGHVNVSPRANRYNSGKFVALTAVPGSGQQFLGWSGAASGSLSPLSVTMNQSKIVTAHFTRRPRLDVVRCFGQPADDNLQIALTGDFDEVYTIQHSTAFTTWFPLMTITNRYGVTQFVDSFVNKLPTRYYRAVSAP